MTKEPVISEREGEFEVTARIMWLGVDLLVALSGGAAHVGVVAVAPAGHKDGFHEIGGQVPVISLPGHKEDVVARGMAENLSKTLRCTVVVVAGMHWDHLDRDGIDSVVRLCARLEERIAAELAV